jgi:hypothetical protein
MTTTVVKTIGSTGDYSTIALWFAACPANLVTADQIWQGQLQNQTFSGSGALVTFTGITTDATRYIELTCVAGASFADNANVQTNALRYNTANGAAITGSGNYESNGPIIVNAQNNLRFTKLQIAATGTQGQAIQNGGAFTPGTGVIVDRCILESVSTHADGTIINGGTGSLAKNCLIINRAASGISAIASVQGSTGNNYYNCTLASPRAVASAAFAGNYGSNTIKNCGFFNATAAKSGSASPTYTTCYTDIASPPSGCTTTAFSTSSGAQFQNITDGTHDFRIKTGSSLIDVGTTDSTNAPTDIAGTSRPSGSAYDVGAWEYVSAAATSNAPRRAFPFSVLQH